MENGEKEKMELETAALVRALQGKWKQIAMGTLLGAVLVLLAAVLFVRPEYQADVVFCVTNQAQADAVITWEDVSASRDLAESCAVIVSTRAFLGDTAFLAGVDRTWSQMQKMVDASPVDETEFLRVTVTGEDPREAAQIANAVGELLPQWAAQVLSGAKVSLVDAAQVPDKPCATGYGTKAMIGLLLGFLVSCGAVVFLEIKRKYHKENAPE